MQINEALSYSESRSVKTGSPDDVAEPLIAVEIRIRGLNVLRLNLHISVSSPTDHETAIAIP
jgi:hypothetical protein